MRKVYFGIDCDIKASVSYCEPLITGFDKKGNRVMKRAEGDISIGDHVVIGDLVKINYGVKCTILEDFCIIGNGANIGHDSHLHRNVMLAPNAHLMGHVELGEYAYLSVGVVVQPHVKIGKRCMIGTLSNVTKDIPDNLIAYGNPCKPVRRNKYFEDGV